MLEARGIDLDIVLTGGSADKPRADVILAKGPKGVVRSLCGQTSLRVTFALVEQDTLILSNSSMLMHAAAAFYRPTVTVLGPMHFTKDDHDLLWG